MKHREAESQRGLPKSSDDGHLSPGWRLRIVQNMLAGLETLTRPGQRAEMAKIVGILEQVLLRDAPAVGPQNRAALLASAFDHLRRESQLPVPNTHTFCQLAGALAELVERAS